IDKLILQYGEPYVIEEIDVPPIGPKDLLVKIGAAGFCHTDYQVYEGVYKSPTPMTPSHEAVGTIVRVGYKAELTRKFRVGQRVGLLNFRHACNSCIGCLTNKDTRFCENKKMSGISADGGFAEYCVADMDNTVLLPDSVTFEQGAPLMCAGATVWNSILQAAVPPGEHVGVLGIGGLGSLAVQFCKAIGLPTVAIDNRTEGRDLAIEPALRADLVVDYNDDEALTQIKSWSGRGGLAAIIVCTDDVEATAWSLKTLRTHGVCMPLGLPGEGFRFDAFDLVFKELVVKGALVATQSQVEDMMQVVARNDIRSHVTAVPFDEVESIPERYMDKTLKGRLVLVF
ncbi:alcohol dehydrogenase GroES-like domain-containing protein, partial [Aureobasidium subglaciale]